MVRNSKVTISGIRHNFKFGIINTHSIQNQTDNFDEIFQAKAQLAKYFKEKYSSEHYQQLPFKYIVKWFAIQKLSSVALRNLAPVMLTAAKTTRAQLAKYLKEKSWSEHHQRHSFKKFIRSFSIQKLSSKVS